MQWGSKGIPFVGILAGISLLGVVPAESDARPLRRGSSAYKRRLSQLTSFSPTRPRKAHTRKARVTRRRRARRFKRVRRRYRNRHLARRFVPPARTARVNDRVLVARLRNRILRLRRCFRRRFVTWTGSGTIHVRVAVRSSGRVARVRVQTRDRGTLADCVKRRVTRWHLGRIGRRIVHSFTVTSGTGPKPISLQARHRSLFAESSD